MKSSTIAYVKIRGRRYPIGTVDEIAAARHALADAGIKWTPVYLRAPAGDTVGDQRNGDWIYAINAPQEQDED